MRVTQINRTTLKGIREAINLSLESTRKLTGLHLKLGNATYSDTNFTFKLEGALKNEDGTVESKEREAFKKTAWIYGLDPKHLDQLFIFNGESYSICGCKPRATKYPILAKRTSDGKMFKFPSDTIKRRLKED